MHVLLIMKVKPHVQMENFLTTCTQAQDVLDAKVTKEGKEANTTVFIMCKQQISGPGIKNFFFFLFL